VGTRKSSALKLATLSRIGRSVLVLGSLPAVVLAQSPTSTPTATPTAAVGPAKSGVLHWSVDTGG